MPEPKDDRGPEVQDGMLYCPCGAYSYWVIQSELVIQCSNCNRRYALRLALNIAGASWIKLEK